MGNVQVGAAIAASFRFVGEAWTKAWGVMLLLLWFTAVLQVARATSPVLVVAVYADQAASVSGRPSSMMGR